MPRALLAMPLVLVVVCVAGTGYGPVLRASEQRLQIAGVATPSTAEPAPTWSRDIAPVLYKNCTTCHHPGGAGPFSLLTYADARRWGPQGVTVTQSRFMFVVSAIGIVRSFSAG